MRRWRRRVVMVAGVAALIAGAILALDWWTLRDSLARARSDIEAGRWARARGQLARLAAARPGAMGGAIDYWLGVSEAIGGRTDGR